MKSYEYLNFNLKDRQLRAVIEKLESMGFHCLSFVLGHEPVVLVIPCGATRLLKFECTGRHRGVGVNYHVYTALLDGVKVVWHKPIVGKIRGRK